MGRAGDGAVVEMPAAGCTVIDDASVGATVVGAYDVGSPALAAAVGDTVVGEIVAGLAVTWATLGGVDEEGCVDAVGALLGVAVGSIVGLGAGGSVGAEDGTAVGALTADAVVGAKVGAPDGPAVGNAVGCRTDVGIGVGGGVGGEVGVAVTGVIGVEVGGVVGSAVGSGVGIEEGGVVGSAVGGVVGLEVGTTVGESVGGVNGAEVGVQVGGVVGSGVGSGVGIDVGSVVGLGVGARVGEVVGGVEGAEVGVQVGAKVGVVVGNAVGAVVGATVGGKHSDWVEPSGTQHHAVESAMICGVGVVRLQRMPTTALPEKYAHAAEPRSTVAVWPGAGSNARVLFHSRSSARPVRRANAPVSTAVRRFDCRCRKRSAVPAPNVSFRRMEMRLSCKLSVPRLGVGPSAPPSISVIRLLSRESRVRRDWLANVPVAMRAMLLFPALTWVRDDAARKSTGSR